MRTIIAWLASITAAEWLPHASGSLELFPAMLQDHIALSDTVTHLEYRLYLPTNFSDRVRVTPVCEGLSFSPEYFDFDADLAVQTGITVQATQTGNWSLEYVATYIGSGSSQLLLSQQLEVLEPPMAYSVGDTGWYGIVLQNDSFDRDDEMNSPSRLWSSQSHGYPSSACGSVDGGKALYFTALGDRFALTSSMNLLGFGGVMHFFHAYGFGTVQQYDQAGNNLISCERSEAGEEVVFDYLPSGRDAANESSWLQLYEVSILNTTTDHADFRSFSINLPADAMHTNAQFRWRQKSHSSFPIDVAANLTVADIVAAENDNTSTRGGLGVRERELWFYRNLFDQWALDNVTLEARLDPPSFTMPSNAGVALTEVTITSEAPGSWVRYLYGDGTHTFPTCKVESAKQQELVVDFTEGGYLHAVSCLVLNDSLITSFPVRSSRIEVISSSPRISSVLDSSASIDVWNVKIECDHCEFMRYSLIDSGAMSTAMQSPSCSYGTLMNRTSGEIAVTFNAIVEVIACGKRLLPSELVTSEELIVHPRPPTFSFDTPETTVSGLMQLTIRPPPGGDFGVEFILGQNSLPRCPSINATSLNSSDVVITVKVFDVVQAVSCCLHSTCDSSQVATWGPMNVRAEAPTVSMACSPVDPLTMVIKLEPVTIGAAIRYRIGPAATPLTCSSGNTYSEAIRVVINSTSVFAVSCLDGLVMSRQIEIPVVVDGCCSGRNAYQYAVCQHVLLMQDDFSDCLNSNKWSKITSQWGGSDVNGGVHADNVQCSIDNAQSAAVGLEAHGDLYTGVLPVGVFRSTASDTMRERTVDDMFLEWALDGVSPTACDILERCPSRRVGAAISTKLTLNAGVFVVRLMPCRAFGTSTQVWWGSYEERTDNGTDEVPFLPMWKSALYQSKSTPTMPLILSSESANTDLSDFVEVVLQWNATEGRANLYFDGKLVEKQQFQDGRSSLAKSLSIGVWFPNAVAGPPLFSTCRVLVDAVQIFDLEVAGGRWCDYEAVQNDAIPCTSHIYCQDWVRSNCFMDIYEAVCIPSTSLAQRFCQFRLYPLAQSGVSVTDMTARTLELEWETDE